MTLLMGDCLERMAEIADGSVDLIAADLPYGTTACKWDVVIPFDPLWEHYRRVLQPRGAVVLTASQPFTSMLVMSNREWFRYSRVWDHVTKTGFLNAKKAPMRGHQDVIVFARGSHTYNPQMIRRRPDEIARMRYKEDRRPGADRAYQADRRISRGRVESGEFKYPSSIIRISARDLSDEYRGLHPTQKPVALFEYLIRTYSNPGDLVLDNAMGSGTTILAAINTDRRAIGIERDPAIFATAERRIARHRASTPLFAEVS